MSAAAENLLGGILLGGKDAYWQVADILRPEDFPSPRLAALYRLCGDIAKAGELDAIAVGDEAERRGVMAAPDVIGLAANTHSSANVRGWAERVSDAALDRRFRAICATGAKSGDRATTMAEISALLNAQPASAIHASAALSRMWDDVMARYNAGDALMGLQTGYPLIDEMTGGLQPGRVYGIGARAKMGKTVLAMNICANVACPPLDRDGNPQWPAKNVAVWSLEMSVEELMQRMTCARAGVPSVLLQRPRLMDSAEEATAKLTVAIKDLRGAPLMISDRTDVTIEQIEAQARQLHAMGQLDLLCIDYLGLLRMPKADRHDLAIAHVTRRVKIIAKELRIPVILVFQLNRGSESGGTVRAPRPSDARDSGAIEQDLDAMFLLHRPSYYDKAAPKGLRLDLAIQRNGPTGLIRLEEELHACRFTGGADEWKDSKQHSTSDDL